MDNSSGNKKKICIIGAGPSGLVSAKSALEYDDDFEVTIFEKSDKLGGVWSIGNGGKAWEQMKTHISYVAMQYSDFEWDDNKYKSKPFHPLKEDMYEYLLNYSNHFNLYNKIKFNSNVIEVLASKLKENDKWIVKWNTTTNDDDDDDDDIVNEEVFDFIIVACGLFSKIRELNVKDKLNSFNGKIWNSSQFKNSKPFINKRVLVIGGQSSAIEISSNISTVTKECYLLCKRNPWVIQRNNIDYCLLKREVSHSSPQPTTKTTIDYFNSISNNQLENEYFKRIAPTNGQNFFVVSDDFIDNIKSGKIKTISKNNLNISKCYDKTIEFTNDGDDDSNDTKEIIEFDDIICCNGYDIDLSFFKLNEINESISLDLNETIEPILLYNHIFSPNLKNIAFVGLYVGSSFQENEISARYIIYNFKNNFKSLPSIEIMNQSIKQLEIENRNFKNSIDKPQFSLRHSQIEFCDKLAKEIGVLPNLDQLKLTEPLLYQINQNKLFHPSFYRLVGPFSNFEKFKNLIIKDAIHFFGNNLDLNSNNKGPF